MSATARDADAGGPTCLGLSSEQLAVTLLFAGTGGHHLFLAPAQSDTWWLLRAGADIWHTHAVPLKDTYSFTAAGAAWPNHEWLFEAVMYAAYKAGGMAAVSALCAAAAIIAASSISWRLMRGGFNQVRVVCGVPRHCCGWLGAAAAGSDPPCLRPHVQAGHRKPRALVAGAVSRMVKRARRSGARHRRDRRRRRRPVVHRARRLPWRLVIVGALCGGTTFLTPLG